MQVFFHNKGACLVRLSYFSWLSAGWQLFATSHRKSPCARIGCTMKRQLIYSSLQNNHILNLDALYSWCIENNWGIIFIKSDSKAIQCQITKFALEKRYLPANKLQCSRTHLYFILTANSIEMRITSETYRLKCSSYMTLH